MGHSGQLRSGFSRIDCWFETINDQDKDVERETEGRSFVRRWSRLKTCVARPMPALEGGVYQHELINAR